MMDFAALLKATVTAQTEGAVARCRVLSAEEVRALQRADLAALRGGDKEPTP
jgi:hypothetical protein